MDFESLTVNFISEFCTGEDESSSCLIETHHCRYRCYRTLWNTWPCVSSAAWNLNIKVFRGIRLRHWVSASRRFEKSVQEIFRCVKSDPQEKGTAKIQMFWRKAALPWRRMRYCPPKRLQGFTQRHGASEGLNFQRYQTHWMFYKAVRSLNRLLSVP